MRSPRIQGSWSRTWVSRMHETADGTGTNTSRGGDRGREDGGNSPIIRVSTLSSGYASSHILFDVHFEAMEQEITVVVGPNGSGKSTLLKSIFGLCAIYEGQIRFHDRPITELTPHEIARRDSVPAAGQQRLCQPHDQGEPCHGRVHAGCKRVHREGA